MLKVKHISFSYDQQRVLDDISFEVDRGQHLSIIGESGSGKSTLLKLLYGEFDLDAGSIFWNNQPILGPDHNLVIGYDFMKYVSQEFDLMPFISVEENVGKFLSNFFLEEKQERVSELLDVVELHEFAKTKVKLLSGGQKQRVALARAIAKQPQIILLDEPFSHIDNFKKRSLRRSLFKYLKANNITCIVATHDKDDVLGFADQMIVLNNSTVDAKNTPQHLYKSPESNLVASFFGEFNTIDGQIIYANQLKVVDHSNLKVIVINSYFKGSYYLIESKASGNVVFFEHPIGLQKNNEIFLEIITL